MQQICASQVSVVGSPDEGLVWIEFQWPDVVMGWESLRIAFDSLCSRRMLWRTGFGLRGIQLRRNSILLSLTEDLSHKLELPVEVEISFDLSDAEFAELQSAVDCIGWSSPPLDSSRT